MIQIETIVLIVAIVLFLMMAGGIALATERDLIELPPSLAAEQYDHFGEAEVWHGDDCE